MAIFNCYVSSPEGILTLLVLFCDIHITSSGLEVTSGVSRKKHTQFFHVFPIVHCQGLFKKTLQMMLRHARPLHHFLFSWWTPNPCSLRSHWLLLTWVSWSFPPVIIRGWEVPCIYIYILYKWRLWMGKSWNRDFLPCLTGGSSDHPTVQGAEGPSDPELRAFVNHWSWGVPSGCVPQIIHGAGKFLTNGSLNVENHL